MSDKIVRPMDKAALPDQPVKTSPSSFLIMNFSSPNEMRSSRSLTQIRRHAMKDIGLQRRKPKKAKKIWDVDLQSTSPSQTLTKAPQPTLHPTLGGGRAYTFFPIPVPLTETSKTLIDVIFQPSLPYSQRAHREDWFVLALADEGTFYQVLATSEMYRLMACARGGSEDSGQYGSVGVVGRVGGIAGLGGDGVDGGSDGWELSERMGERDGWVAGFGASEVAAQFHTEAIATVRRRLAMSPPDVSDGTVACVAAFMAYDAVTRNRVRWREQFKGLVSVINAREGGFESLERNVSLRTTISWIELIGAGEQDKTPVFPLPSTWLTDYDLARYKPEIEYGSKDLTSALQRWSILIPDHHDLLLLFEDLAFFSVSVSDQIDILRQNAMATTPTWIDVMTHKLLSMQTVIALESDPEVQVQAEAMRLAMLVYSLAISNAFGVHLTSADLLVAKQYSLLSKPTNVERLIPDSLYIWVLVISLLATSPGATQDWFIGELVTTGEAHGFSCAADILQMVEGLVWVKNVHGKKVPMIQDLLNDQFELYKSLKGL